MLPLARRGLGLVTAGPFLDVCCCSDERILRQQPVQLVGWNVLMSLVALLSAVLGRDATVVTHSYLTSTNWAVPERSGRTNMAPWPAYGRLKDSSSWKAGAA